MENDIIRKLKSEFGSDADKAIELLKEFGVKNELSPRVQRCIVALSKGDLTKLKENITKAEFDWRDIIFLGESYPFEFNSPFK